MTARHGSTSGPACSRAKDRRRVHFASEKIDPFRTKFSPHDFWTTIKSTSNVRHPTPGKLLFATPHAVPHDLPAAGGAMTKSMANTHQILHRGAASSIPVGQLYGILGQCQY